MASLLDIATVARTVPVETATGPVNVNVYGVSAQSIAELMVRFPDIGKSFSGGKPPAAEDIIKFAPEAIAAIIAAGTGSPGNEEAEAVAAKLGVGVQADILQEVFRLTFPRGVGPFAEMLRQAGVLAEAVIPSVQSSPVRSSTSSKSDTPTPGASPPDKSTSGSS